MESLTKIKEKKGKDDGGIRTSDPEIEMYKLHKIRTPGGWDN